MKILGDISDLEKFKSDFEQGAELYQLTEEHFHETFDFFFLFFLLLFLNQSQSLNKHIYFNMYGASSANKSTVMEDYNTCRKHKYEHFLLLALFLYDWVDLKLQRHCFERSGCCFPISSRSKNERHFLLVYVAPDFTCLGAVLYPIYMVFGCCLKRSI